MTGTLRERLIALIEPVVADLGCELVDVDLNPGLVRIFVDRAGGVRIEDCERVSREVSALLDVEDPIPTAIGSRCPHRASIGCCARARILSASSERVCGLN